MTVVIIVLAFIAMFIALIVARTIVFAPPKAEEPSYEEISFDKAAAERSLAELVKCRTVSNARRELEDDREFEKLIGLLPVLYPHVIERCPLTRMEDRALLFHWKGRGDGRPTVLMAHYDVVPVEEENWEKPPFDAVVEDGVMWGRGTLDTKVTFNGILSAAEELIKGGFTPENDVYFAFSGGEEVNGRGAVNIVEYFADRGIELSWCWTRAELWCRACSPG